MEKNNSCRSSYNRSNFQRSNSPSSRFCSSSISSRSMSSFSSASRSTSPTRVSVRKGCMKPTYLVRFSLDHGHRSSDSSVARRNISDRNNNNNSNTNNTNSNKVWSHGSRKTCLCSPTTHPGSFRCSLHKNSNNGTRNMNGSSNENDLSYRSHRLYARRSAMTNSLVRIGTVEGDLVKRALASLIRPSSHQQKRRNDFQRRPSRLSVMSKADE